MILMKEELAYLRVRIPRQLKRLMRRYVEIDTHINESDLTRDAIREKIRKDAPALFAELFEETSARKGDD